MGLLCRGEVFWGFEGEVLGIGFLLFRFQACPNCLGLEANRLGCGRWGGWS